ncbi:hypothetical protein BCR34DRAFT_575385 [Clohesyomyces aquaticus]|uniref:Uncharacterized protein n=1 Tax=Clohesyomyces aquaticus TaxID=1231657 RepID=A0A1Y1YT22_9PLEO|nr:hypothetical protein BCR34DRAFT_575385 [Clohesyomyces aquaticus]
MDHTTMETNTKWRSRYRSSSSDDSERRLNSHHTPFAYRVKVGGNSPIYLSSFKVPEKVELCAFCYPMVGLISLPVDDILASNLGYLLRRETRWQAESCKLCRLISMHVVDHAGDRPKLPDPSTSPLVIHFLVRHSEREIYYGKGPASICEIGLGSSVVPVVGQGIQGDYQAVFTIWAEKDAPASIQLTTRPPLLSSETRDIIAHTHSWLEECMLEHEREAELTRSELVSLGGRF